MFNSLRDLKLSYKFIFAFGLICLLSLLQGIAAIAGLYRINHLTLDLTGRTQAALEETSDLRQQMQAARRMELAMLLCTDQGCVERYIARRGKAIDEHKKASERFLALQLTSDERSAFDAANSAYEQYESSSGSIVRDFAAQDHKDVSQLGGREQQLLGTFNQALDGMDALGQHFADESGKDTTQLNDANSLARWMVLGVMLLASGLCYMIGRVLTQLIAPPIERVTAALEAVAKNDLTQTVEVNGEDETGRLSAALNKTVQSMRSILHTLTDSVDALARAAQELNQRSTSTSANTHLQSDKDQPDCRRRAGDDGHHSRDQHERTVSRRSQPPVGRNRRTGRHGDAARLGHHGADCLNHRIGEQQDGFSGHALGRDRQSGQRDSGDQRADQPAGSERRH